MKTSFFSFLLAVILIGCCKPDALCEREVIISEQQYENAPNDPLTIKSLSITDDCLKIEFTASGCDGNSWDVKLIDSGVILKSLPPQKNLRLSLKNQELCQALFTKEMTFDISGLRIDEDKIRLNLTNGDKHIIYHIN
jgi:hypothetical protein